MTVSKSTAAQTAAERLKAVLSETQSRALGSDRLADPGPIRSALCAFEGALGECVEVVASHPATFYRLYDSLGYKTFSPEQLRERFARLDHGGLQAARAPVGGQLLDFLADSLESKGFMHTEWRGFDRWPEVVACTVVQIASLSAEPNYKHDVLIFLNGPLVDTSREPLTLRVPRQGGEVVVQLEYASDELLSTLAHEGDLYPVIGKINTVARYSVKVPVAATEGYYQQEYDTAGNVAALLQTALRLGCCDEIGVLAVRIAAAGPLTPLVREGMERRFQTQDSSILPRRFILTLRNVEPLSPEGVAAVQRAVERLDQVPPRFKGLDQAIRRFENGIERYKPDEPERLLEYAMALEAVFLTSDYTGEVQYRLALRMARFLETELEKRMKTFKVVRQLYRHRSKIAHGEALQGIAGEVPELLSSVPNLVARSITGILNLPEDELLKDKDVLWREIELRNG